MASSSRVVRSEVEEKTSLAVVFGGGKLGELLVKDLKKQELSVLFIAKDEQVLPILMKPAYVFFFLSGTTLAKRQFDEALESAKKASAKVILIEDSVTFSGREWWRKIVDSYGLGVVLVEIKGKVAETRLAEVASRIMRFAFTASLGEEKLILAKEDSDGVNLESFPKLLVANGREISIGSVYKGLNKYGGGRLRRSWREFSFIFSKRAFFVAILGVILLGLFFPVIAASYHAFWGWSELFRARDSLASGRFYEAGNQADRAVWDFQTGKAELLSWSRVAGYLGMTSVNGRGFEVLSLGERAGLVVRRVGRIAPLFEVVAKNLIGGGGSGDLSGTISQVRLELGPLSEEVGFLQAQSRDMMRGRTSILAGLFGLSVAKMGKYQEDMTSLRAVLTEVDGVLLVLPQILDSASGGADGKKYLVIFQNSAELRPTGGFIGSYAIVNVKKGMVVDFRINDIYSADGQLRGHINPPDEILHFLGQPSWFMRDANFAADFPLTARRLEWFLEKETGEQVSGVIAIDQGLVAKLLAATGPLAVSGYNDKVTAENFFDKAEYQAEINFFPGSTQKKDFLSSVAMAILGKIATDSGKDWMVLGKALSQAFSEKNILFYFNDASVQKVMETNLWSGSIATRQCLAPAHNCLMVVEANFGANKANYFVSKLLKVQTVLDKGGGMETTVSLSFRNDSPSVSWPGGDYKDYLRFLVPRGSGLLSMDLGDNRTATISPILTADVLSRVLPSQFLVYAGNEVALGEGLSTLGSYNSFGTLLVVPIQTARTVTIKYKPNYRVDYSTGRVRFNFTVLKQPGTGTDSLDFALDYPSFLSPEESTGANSVTGGKLNPLVFTQRLIYNTDLSTDRVFEVVFSKQS